MSPEQRSRLHSRSTAAWRHCVGRKRPFCRLGLDQAQGAAMAGHRIAIDVPFMPFSSLGLVRDWLSFHAREWRWRRNVIS